MKKSVCLCVPIASRDNGREGQVGFEDEDDGSFFMLWSDFVQVSPWSFF